MQKELQVVVHTANIFFSTQYCPGISVFIRCRHDLHQPCIPFPYPALPPRLHGVKQIGSVQLMHYSRQQCPGTLFYLLRHRRLFIFQYKMLQTFTLQEHSFSKADRMPWHPNPGKFAAIGKCPVIDHLYTARKIHFLYPFIT